MALNDTQVDKFLGYLELLLRWNLQARLTALTEPIKIIHVHFVDSLLALRATIGPGATLVDVGSGAGFPGIPIKIARPDVSVTVLEANRRKVAFLEHVADELEVDVHIKLGRAELVGHQPGWRESFDVATARAVAPLAVACELTLPLVRVGGKSVLLQGPTAHRQLARGSKAANCFGGGSPTTIEDTLAGGERRVIVIVPKVAPTPASFPRRPGVPARKPLG